jgi:hypothetical protein
MFVKTRSSTYNINLQFAIQLEVVQLPSFAALPARSSMMVPENDMNEVNDMLLDKTPLPANIALQRMRTKLMGLGLAHVMENLSPNLFLVHPDNRSKLMLDWDEAQAKTVKVKKAGVDRRKLCDSAAFEIPLSGSLRFEILEANRNKIAMSQGRMAPISGDERFASVATSHVSQGGKAINVGCLTDITEFAVDGRLSKDAFVRDDQPFEQFLAGWDWTIFKAECLELWPEMPAWMEVKYNASNTIAKGKTELECMNEAFGQLSRGWDIETVVASIMQSQPECGAYMHTICGLAKEFIKTGTDMQSLHDFALRYGDGLKLGQEYQRQKLTRANVFVATYTSVVFFCVV